MTHSILTETTNGRQQQETAASLSSTLGCHDHRESSMDLDETSPKEQDCCFKTAVLKRMIDSVIHNDMETLRNILLFHPSITDTDIDEALGTAVVQENIAACRLLFCRLGKSGKEKYFVTTPTSMIKSDDLASLMGHLYNPAVWNL